MKYLAGSCQAARYLAAPYLTALYLTSWAGLLALAGLLTCSAAAAQTISYTVQVAALSDQASAESLRRTLRDEGYPAYLVSVPGDTQTIYRLRVGAFADRDGAQAYASAMRGVGGTVPVPALAEGIPPDLIPLEPRFTARYSVSPSEQLEVVPWGDAAALRTQGRAENEPLLPVYRVLTPGLAAAPFTAWRAAPLPDAAPADANVALRVTDLPLAAPGEQNVSSEGALSVTGRSRLLEAAEALGLGEAQIRPYIFYKPGQGAPFLVVAERFDPVSKAGGRYPALGKPGGQLKAAGPDLTWFSTSPPEMFPKTLPDPLFSLSSLLQQGKLEPPTGVLSGRGWRAAADGRYTALSVGSRRWRAVVGQPLWAGGDFLLVYVRPQVVLYQVTPPSR